MSSPTPTEPRRTPVTVDREHRRRKAVQYVASLDGLRAIAACGVLLIHTQAAVDLPLVPYITTGAIIAPFFSLFFAISGFVLYRGWARRHLAIHDPEDPAAPSAAGGADGRTGSFLLRRLLRIYPLYWAVATAALLASGTSRSTSVVDLLQVYTLSPLPNFDALVELGLGLVVWTLIIDVVFYLYVAVHGPILHRVLARLPRRWTPFSVETAVLATMAVGFPLLGFWVPGPVAALSCLVVGMWFAVIEAHQDRLGHRLPAVRTMVRAWPVWLALYLVVAPLVVAYVVTSEDPGTVLAQNTGIHVLAVMFAALLLILVLWGPERWAARRALMSTRMQQAALLTYGLYLWHPVVLILLGRHLPDEGLAVYLTITVIGSVLLALSTYLLIERPLARRRVGLRRTSVRAL